MHKPCTSEVQHVQRNSAMGISKHHSHSSHSSVRTNGVSRQLSMAELAYQGHDLAAELDYYY